MEAKILLAPRQLETTARYDSDTGDLIISQECSSEAHPDTIRIAAECVVDFGDRLTAFAGFPSAGKSHA